MAGIATGYRVTDRLDGVGAGERRGNERRYGGGDYGGANVLAVHAPNSTR